MARANGPQAAPRRLLIRRLVWCWLVRAPASGRDRARKQLMMDRGGDRTGLPPSVPLQHPFSIEYLCPSSPT